MDTKIFDEDYFKQIDELIEEAYQEFLALIEESDNKWIRIPFYLGLMEDFKNDSEFPPDLKVHSVQRVALVLNQVLETLDGKDCQTCNGLVWSKEAGKLVSTRETVGMVCSGCGTDYSKESEK